MFKSLFNIISVLVMLTSCAVADHKETTGEYIDDSVITMRVKSALAENPNVKSYDINVKTLKGAVQLSGFVDKKSEAAVAGAVASNVNGVKKVHNNIVVQSTSKSFRAASRDTASDTLITSKIKASLLAEENLSSTKIKVRTDNGHVLLSGSVPTQSEVERAEKIASEVKGVKSVQNQIQVQK
jgi:hyperosmotically inducible protein